MVGYIDEEKIISTVFEEIPRTLFLFAGSLKVYNIFFDALTTKLKVPNNQIYRF